MPPQLSRLYKIAAGAHGINDFIALMESRRDQICDVRTKLGDNASVEVREIAAAILTDTIDTLKRMRKDGKEVAEDPDRDLG